MDATAPITHPATTTARRMITLFFIVSILLFYFFQVHRLTFWRDERIIIISDESSVSSKTRHFWKDCIIVNNQEKNTYVREQITKALLHLLQTKRLDDISVSELTEQAQVGRASFYRNYQSLSDILFQYDKLMINEWATGFERDPSSSFFNVFGSLFQHYKDHADFYLLLYKNGLTETILETIKARLDINDGLENEDAYMKSFLAYGIYGWVMEWMKRGMVEEFNDINAMLTFQKPF